MICVGLELQYWRFVKDDIEQTLAGGYSGATADDLYQRIIDKDVQLWAIHDNGDMRAVMTTEIVNYKRKKAVRIITVTGKNADEWLDVLIDTISRWGAENGCTSLEFVGRNGWEKVLRKKEFGNTQIFMERPIKCRDGTGEINNALS